MESFTATIRRLHDKGVRYATVIDVGCADGDFFLTHMQFFPGAVPLNIDANRLYEDSLRAIKDLVGGDFRITAITDYVGEIELTQSVHPYWSSIRPSGDPYWCKMNNLAGTTVKVKATTAEAGFLESRDVNKYIFATPAVRPNKSVPFLRIEPFHGAARHSQSPTVLTVDDSLANST